MLHVQISSCIYVHVFLPCLISLTARNDESGIFVSDRTCNCWTKLLSLPNPFIIRSAHMISNVKCRYYNSTNVNDLLHFIRVRWVECQLVTFHLMTDILENAAMMQSRWQSKAYDWSSNNVHTILTGNCLMKTYVEPNRNARIFTSCVGQIDSKSLVWFWIKNQNFLVHISWFPVNYR